MTTLAVRFGMGPAIAAGVIGGLAFAAFEMMATAVLMGPQAVFIPL